MAAIFSFLAGTKAGRALGISAIAVALMAGAWVWGDIHGHHTQSAKDAKAIATAVVRAEAAESANATNQTTITALKAANANWAAQADASKARAAAALSTLTTTRNTLMSQLAASQAKLRSIENDHPDVHAWSCQNIPIQVLELIVGADAARSVRSESGCEDANRGSKGSSNSTNPQGIDPAGAGAATAQQ